MGPDSGKTQRYRYVHPFPARMAPEIALQAINALPPKSTVVDPMCGSGLVLREAIEQGHDAIGFDVDPLAVLMSKVWTRSLRTSMLTKQCKTVIREASALKSSDVFLPWIDGDEDTSKYIDFWFAESQREQLRKLAHLLAGKRGPINYALQLAISRTIITKKTGASLAWDVSHSRPHRVKKDNDYDVFAGFESAVSKIAEEIDRTPQNSNATVRIGNARRLGRIANGSVDAVITSPPYFNAIDYIRGHRLSLVWLGYQVGKLRQIRSGSVGSEKGVSQRRFDHLSKNLLDDFDFPTDLDESTGAHFRRYIMDMTKVIGEISRILKPRGLGVLVVANSNIHGQTVDNAGIIKAIARNLGLREVNCIEREIPSIRRYLPPPTATAQESLQKRMRFESILTLESPAILCSS